MVGIWAHWVGGDYNYKHKTIIDSGAEHGDQDSNKVQILIPAQ